MAVLEKEPELSLHVNGSFVSEFRDENLPAKNNKSIFQTALQSVERKFGISHSLKEQVEDEYLDFELTRNLLAEESLTMSEPMEPERVSGASTHEYASARLLSLKSKQQAAESVHASILQGVDVLTSVAERANQVNSYLQKLESEIEKLENVEAHSDRLRTVSAKLAQDHRDVIATNTELKRTVAELEIQVSSTREDLEAAHMQLDRNNDEKLRLEDKIESQGSRIVKLESNTSDLREQIEERERAHSEVKRKHYDAVLQIDELSQKVRQRDSDLARQKTISVDMEHLIEQQQIAMADIRAKLDSSSSANVAGKSELNSTISKLDAERRENEAKNSLQLKRIAELEAQNQALNRQLIETPGRLQSCVTPPPTEQDSAKCSNETKKIAVQDEERMKIAQEFLPDITT